MAVIVEDDFGYHARAAGKDYYVVNCDKAWFVCTQPKRGEVESARFTSKERAFSFLRLLDMRN
jgi:hypothetical protein